MKKLVIKIAFGFAKKIITTSRIKDEFRNIMTVLAAKAVSKSGYTEIGLEKTAQILAAMKDGKVDVAEADQILGTLVTDENLNKAFDYIEARVMERV